MFAHTFPHLPTLPLTLPTQELDICKTLSHEHIVGYIDSHYDNQCNTLSIFLEYGKLLSQDNRGNGAQDLALNSVTMEGGRSALLSMLQRFGILLMR